MPILANARHERFAQELAKGKSQAEAYEAAGYSPSEPNASRMTRNDKVQARVAELQTKGAERTALTIETVTNRLLLIADKAEALSEASGLAVARAAMMDAAKINGLIVERSENVNINHAISGDLPTEAEWENEHVTEH